MLTAGILAPIVGIKGVHEREVLCSRRTLTLVNANEFGGYPTLKTANVNDDVDALRAMRAHFARSTNISQHEGGAVSVCPVERVQGESL